MIGLNTKIGSGEIQYLFTCVSVLGGAVIVASLYMICEKYVLKKIFLSKG